MWPSSIISRSFWPPEAERIWMSGDPSGSSLGPTNAKSIDGGSSCAPATVSPEPAVAVQSLRSRRCGRPGLFRREAWRRRMRCLVAQNRGYFSLLLSKMNSALLQLNYPLFCATKHRIRLLQAPRRNSPGLPHLRLRRLCAATAGSGETVAGAQDEPPSIDFAFVSPRLLPDGSPDIQIRSASGGQKLRDIMLDGHIDLYGPYDAPLSNCSGFGTCGTCLVEVVEGKELLSPRTDKEKEALKKKPKTWRLACQTTVGERDSRGEVVIQQLPEWKVIKWE